MIVAALINGAAPSDLAHAIAATDRGLHYGDGLFETALLADGNVRYLEDHLQRLALGCERLGIRAPERTLLLSEIEQVTASRPRGVLKIAVTRGGGARGYRPSAQADAMRAVMLYAAVHPVPPREFALRWCETRLARNARLAGIKHLNRLEQVLAQAEWQDERIGEGLMLDTEGELVSGTASNVFIVRDNSLVTPDLRFCGVRGIMRGRVLRIAAQLGIPATEEPLWPHDVETASEVFVTNAVRGIRAATTLGTKQWDAAPVSDRIRAALEQ